jgi:hypothetical protein
MAAPAGTDTSVKPPAVGAAPPQQPPAAVAATATKADDTAAAALVNNDTGKKETPPITDKKWSTGKKLGLAAGVVALLLLAGMITGVSLRGVDFLTKDIPNFFHGNIPIYI